LKLVIILGFQGRRQLSILGMPSFSSANATCLYFVFAEENVSEE